MDDDPLTEWRDILLGGFDLDDDEVLDDVTLDVTASSLRGLATYAQQLDSDDEESVPAVAAYLGETLMRAGGGCWAWIDELPLVRLDDALGLAPVRPVQLVEEADRSFEAVHAEWAAAAARVAAERPGWPPAREETDLDLLDDPTQTPSPGGLLPESRRWPAVPGSTFPLSREMWMELHDCGVRRGAHRQCGRTVPGSLTALTPHRDGVRR